jgi:hypothetical protein
MMRIQLSGEWKDHGEYLIDHRTEAAIEIFASLDLAELSFNMKGNPKGSNLIAIAVPSVVVAVWNVVLYPQAATFFDHVSVEDEVPFEFDPRLFAEGAVLEAS